MAESVWAGSGLKEKKAKTLFVAQPVQLRRIALRANVRTNVRTFATAQSQPMHLTSG